MTTDQERYDDVCNWLADLVPATTTFVLRRTTDVTGLSGTGVVADGAIFPDMRPVTRWRGGTTGVAQTCVWDNIQHVRRIHGHDGATRIELVPYGVLAKMIVAAMEAEQGGGSIVAAIAGELAEHRAYEADLNRVARGEPAAEQDELARCCDLHGRNCEQGNECCYQCTEAYHFRIGHGGVTCSAPDLSAGGAVDPAPAGEQDEDGA